MRRARSPNRVVRPGPWAIGHGERARSPSIVSLEEVREIVHRVGPGDPALAAIAARQLNLVTRAQLLAAGLGRGAIRHRLANGRLHRRHLAVYLAGTELLLPRATELAAVLACGPGALVSHRAAAVLWGILPTAPGPIHITLVDTDRRPAGIQAHRPHTLRAEDRDHVHGIPVTAPARTLNDLASTHTPTHDLGRALNEARVLKLVTDNALQTQPSRRLRALLTHQAGPTLTRSEAERKALTLIHQAGLPRPDANARVGPYEVDLLWPDHRLIVEIDGYAYHSGRAAFERDHRKTAALGALDHTVIRVTWRWLTQEPHSLVATLAGALATRSPPASSGARARGA